MDTRNWYAWINLMPPKPDDFHIVGEVLVGNPGIQAELSMKHPQGINPKILLLDLHWVQRPGIWPEVMTWVQCRYDSIVCPGSESYERVQVFCDVEEIASMEVDVVS